MSPKPDDSEALEGRRSRTLRHTGRQWRKEHGRLYSVSEEGMEMGSHKGEPAMAAPRLQLSDLFNYEGIDSWGFNPSS